MPSLYDQILQTWQQQRPVSADTNTLSNTVKFDVGGQTYSVPAYQAGGMTGAQLTQMFKGGGAPTATSAVPTASGGVPGSTSGGFTPIQMPTPVKTDPFQYTLDNSDKIASIAELVNNINQKAQQAANAGRIPGGGDLEAKSSQNINQALSGVVPADVLYQIGQQAAQRGAMSGSPLGASTNADYLRALGLTSLGLQDKGQSWLTAATARNPAAPLFDTGSLVMTPQQQGALDNAAQSLAQQLYLGQLDDSTKRWMAQLDSDTRVKLLTLAENYRQNGIGPKPWKSYGANWQPWMATSGGGTVKPDTSTAKPNYDDLLNTPPSGGSGVGSYNFPDMTKPGMSTGSFDVVQPGMDASYAPWSFGDTSGLTDAIYGPAPTGADELFPGFLGY